MEQLFLSSWFAKIIENENNRDSLEALLLSVKMLGYILVFVNANEKVTNNKDPIKQNYSSYRFI